MSRQAAPAEIKAELSPLLFGDFCYGLATASTPAEAVALGQITSPEPLALEPACRSLAVSLQLHEKLENLQTLQRRRVYCITDTFDHVLTDKATFRTDDMTELTTIAAFYADSIKETRLSRQNVRGLFDSAIYERRGILAPTLFDRLAGRSPYYDPEMAQRARLATKAISAFFKGHK